MPAIVCVKCGKFMSVKKNGVVVEEMMPRVITPGDEVTEWRPYKLWRADHYECRGCGFEVVSGFGHNPVAEHYMVDVYQKARASQPPLVQVTDCSGVKP